MIKISFILAFFLWIGSARAEDPLLGDRFGAHEDSIAVILIRETAGVDSARAYSILGRPEKVAFLQSHWRTHNPLFGRLYYGYHLGYRHLTVSDAFFERGDVIPFRYRFGAVAPDTAAVIEAASLCKRILGASPDDLVAQCALAYTMLEQGKGVEAEQAFLKVIQKDKKLLAARHGRALACLIQNKRARTALDYFQETVSMDPAYEAAVYNSALCHLAMRSVDIDHQFGKVVRRFPSHYDAYYKLGVFYESLRYFNKAIEAYSRQVAVNPGHKAALGNLARVALEMRYLDKEVQSAAELRDLAEKDPKRYLPLLAAQLLDQKAYEASLEAYRKFLILLPDDERKWYEDVSLLTSPDENHALQWSSGQERQNVLSWFWLRADPTPTTQVNERRLEHYRRVHYARQNFSEGRQPWDQRGEVYIRFGHPDHRSWSDHLVFETDKHVVRVKNRLSNLAFNALDEVVPTDFYKGAESFGTHMFRAEMAEIRGFPVFPLPHQGTAFRDGASLNSKWESWIYAHIDGGFELCFHDALGDYDYQFPLPPVDSPNYRLWEYLAPEAVVQRAVSKAPSVYQYAYGGDPLPLFVTTADFKGSEKNTSLDVYLGVPFQDLGLEERGELFSAQLNRTLVLFDSTGAEVHRDSLNTEASVKGPPAGGQLWIDQETI
ncbi:MAG: GWxTD domain-containing protein, partial [bacterium]|nr:GWxTD domain-containing protein [bacterium]